MQAPIGPICLAIARQRGLRSAQTISAAPSAFSAATSRQPIGPTPDTKTFFPVTSPGCFAACIATASGSANTITLSSQSAP